MKKLLNNDLLIAARLWFIAICVIVLGFSLPAHAEGYFALKGATGKTEISENHNTTAPGIAAGYDFGNIRAEFEYFVKDTCTLDDIKTEIDTETFFFNIYKDFPVNKKFELYAGGGAGIAKHSNELVDGSVFALVTQKGEPCSNTNNTLAYNVQAGLTYLISANLAFDLGLRYSDLGTVELWSGVDKDMVSKEAILSIRFAF